MAKTKGRNASKHSDTDMDEMACKVEELRRIVSGHWHVKQVRVKCVPTDSVRFVPQSLNPVTTGAALKSLFTSLIETKCMINFRGILLIYWPEMGQWFFLNSPTAARMVADQIGAQNATVNFADAVAPYVPYLETTCQLVGMDLTSSVCVSKLRYKVKIEDESVVLSPYPPMYEGPDPVSCTVATKPVILNEIKLKTNATSKGKIRKYIETLLGDKHTELLMFAIGCAHVDPVTASYLVMLFDPVGGKGKSTLLELIKTTLSNSVGYADKDEIGGKSMHVSPTMTKLISKYRIVITQDVEFETDTINSKYLKSLITIDSKRTDVGEIPNGVVHLVGTNSLPYFSGKDMTAARFRRMIVIPYKPDIQSKRRGWNMPIFSDSDRFKFLAECVYLSETNISPPFTTESMLYTMFGSLAGKKVRGMTIDEDHYDFQDCKVGTEIIKIVSRVKTEFFDEILSKYATSASVMVDGEYFIKGLIPHKIELVDPSKYPLSCTLRGMPSVWNFGVHPALVKMKAPSWFVNECTVNGKWAHDIVINALNEVEYRFQNWDASKVMGVRKSKDETKLEYKKASSSKSKHTNKNEDVDVSGCTGLVEF